MRIGIPASLLYYLYFPLWEAFFTELGAQVVISGKSNKQILNNGSKVCTSDACIPLKLFHGHVIDLIGKADVIFVPRLKSVAKGEYICPKFCGLPDMVRYSVDGLPPIIDTEVDIRKKSGHLAEAFEEAGSYITHDKKKIKAAAEKALFCNAVFCGQAENGYLLTDVLEGKKERRRIGGGLNVGILGHTYNVYDSFVNMNLFTKLRDAAINAIPQESIPDSVTDRYAEELPKKLFWTFSRKLIGAARYFAESGDVDGVIYIMSFGCGIDSFTADMCERILKKKGIPFYLMMIDEHSCDCGVETRLEAFIDMLKWRRRNEGYLPPHGEHLYIHQDTV